METQQRWAGCTREGNPLPFVTAIVASNPGDFGQGRVGADNTCASRLPYAPRMFLCLKRSKHKLSSFAAVLSRAVHWQN
jgi:hypothetical protein